MPEQYQTKQILIESIIEGTFVDLHGNAVFREPGEKFLVSEHTANAYVRRNKALKIQRTPKKRRKKRSS